MLKKVLILTILILTATSCFALDNMPFSYYRGGLTYDLTILGKTAFAGKKKYDDISHNITITNSILFNLKSMSSLYLGPKLDLLFLFYDENTGSVGRLEGSLYAELDRLYAAVGLSTMLFDSQDGHEDYYDLSTKIEFGVNFFFDQVYYEDFAINLNLTAYPFGWESNDGEWSTVFFNVPTLVNLGLTYYL